MSASKNYVEIIGRIGKLETHKGQKKSFITMSVATDESYKDNQGRKVEVTEWHNIVLFGAQAKFAYEYLGKGRLILVEGKLRTRKWQDQQGQDRYTTEIVGQRIMPLDKLNKSAEQKPEPEPEPRPESEPVAENDDFVF